MNISFYMFGVPDGFDIYQEMPNPQIKDYYQCFYDETIKEGTRLVVHRKSNGEVSYTYLKYHLFSEGNRPNSFIGLSVIFKGGYYADVASLYNLLEYAYKGMLSNGKILRPTANGESAVFQTKRFDFEVTEFRRIEGLILNTLSTNEYSSEFVAWGDEVSSVKQNALLKIPFQLYNDDLDKESELNQFIVQKLKEYSWLSLSSDYIVNAPSASRTTITEMELDEVLDPETKTLYKENFEEYQNKVLSVYKEFISKPNENLDAKVRGLSANIRGILVLLNKYVAKEKELKELLVKYADLSNQLETLINELAKDNQNPSPGSDGKPKEGNWKLISIAGGALLLVACYACFLHPLIFKAKFVVDNPDSTGIHIGPELFQSGVEIEVLEAPSLEELVAQFNTAVQENNFKIASELYNQIPGGQDKIIRGLDKTLDDKFQALISNRKFSLANTMLKECFCKVYEVVSLYENDLKKALKGYIQANKNDFKKKNALIAEIERAKREGYGYAGIDMDLVSINALSASPSPNSYTLYVYEKAKDTPKKHVSNNTIILEVNVLYRIRVEHVVEGAKLLITEDQHKKYEAWHGNEDDKFYNKYKDHMVLLKSVKEGYTEFDYKKGDDVLCKIKVKFVNSSSLSSKGINRL